MKKEALIIVDVQNDFLPCGSLAVPKGDQIIPVINQLQKKFTLVLATKDWHPADHGSFASNHPGKQPGDTVDLNGIEQILWPDHCIQDTKGVEFAPALNTVQITKVFLKGTNPRIDSYSTFFDNAHRRSTGLGEYLRDQAIDVVYLAGLATDYCVKYSALDACELNLETCVITDACRGIDLNPGDIKRAWDGMKQAGVRLISSKDILF